MPDDAITRARQALHFLTGTFRKAITEGDCVRADAVRCHGLIVIGQGHAAADPLHGVGSFSRYEEVGVFFDEIERFRRRCLLTRARED